MSKVNANSVIINRHAKLEADMDVEVERVYRTEQRSQRQFGSNILNVKGLGHRTIGAKRHGKCTIGLSGSGYGRSSSERLHRIY